MCTEYLKNSLRDRIFQHHKRFLRNYWVNCCKSLFTFTAVKTTYCCNKSLHKFTAVNKIHTDLQKKFHHFLYALLVQKPHMVFLQLQKLHHLVLIFLHTAVCYHSHFNFMCNSLIYKNEHSLETYTKKKDRAMTCPYHSLNLPILPLK